MPPNKIIIDTDPGVDDVMALLLAFAAKPEELEVLLVSLTFGNIDVQNCLRNLVTLFHWIDKEIAWRRENGLPEGFDTLRARKPIVAVGAEEPLADQMMMADYFHGIDGLGGIHSSHPHLTPEETWKHLFSSALNSSDKETQAAAREAQQSNALFTPSTRPSYEEILRLLRENEPDTITVVAVGPLTNLATAAAHDPETFLRAKEVVVMGGAIDVSGNVRSQPPLHPVAAVKPPPFNLIKAPDSPLRAMLNNRNQMTPVAEFNTYADSIAAARVFALTSPNPASTMPPPPPPRPGQQDQPPPPFLQPYPTGLSKQLKLTIFPLDITTPHELTRGQFTKATDALSSKGSPLATWVTAFLSSTFRKVESLRHIPQAPEAVGLELHDPLCIWYMWKYARDARSSEPDAPEDIRVETSGQWTRGMCVVDRRDRRKRDDDVEGEKPGDTGNWLGKRAGNRVSRIVSTPGTKVFGQYLLERVFGVDMK
ncbi:uncharacterized protein K452DRAFT_324563 [Aplosporella prunicola CBS 121167]|uniref:Inosine/uridine-preferring nucleoside hydrolase domain-containing protein n=1 Tax=Aplosporella prunicola CBS 121167 TaxID=1176127 RepID=A0A6A6BS47_9PEZI|nr:uncharacterized protein K452DRAFT_324563 [Aplosporella prunicola CBS 121167]KAF2145647.1 hypothetical protein K452DRAFT_324563 [Aplosporella prunicola CBS 121167]